jgi:hypothetical protein
MPWSVLITTALALLQVVLGQVTKSNLPAEIVADVQAALDALTRVHGAQVTKAQVDSLRLT